MFGPSVPDQAEIDAKAKAAAAAAKKRSAEGDPKVSSVPDKTLF